MSASTQPTMVFRSSYVRVRHLLMLAVAVIVALAIALVIVAVNDDGASSAASTPAASDIVIPPSNPTPCGMRYDSPGFVGVPCTNEAQLPH